MPALHSLGDEGFDVFNFIMKSLFITFEGTEGCGKSTQVDLLAERLRALGHRVRVLREPGGTPIGEEIRHTLKHSKVNVTMTYETELLLMNASRAQLVRETIRPALAVGEIVLCDRFYDSTTAYQGYGRGLDLALVKSVIDFAVGDTRPDLTLLLHVPPEVSAERLQSRQSTLPFVRDRLEEGDKYFFERVAQGYEAIAAAEPNRVRVVSGAGTIEVVCENIWELVRPILPHVGRW
ncbi:MAG: dTMP kinase [Verrucomicrobiota bacterium]|jgi:dTMP kinase